MQVKQPRKQPWMQLGSRRSKRSSSWKLSWQMHKQRLLQPYRQETPRKKKTTSQQWQQWWWWCQQRGRAAPAEGGKRRIGKRRKQGRPSTRPLSSDSNDEDDGVGNVHKSAYQMAHKHVLEGSQMAHKHVLEGSHQNNLFMIANTALQTKSNKDQIDAIAMLLKSK